MRASRQNKLFFVSRRAAGNKEERGRRATAIPGMNAGPSLLTHVTVRPRTVLNPGRVGVRGLDVWRRRIPGLGGPRLALAPLPGVSMMLAVLTTLVVHGAAHGHPRLGRFASADGRTVE